MDTTTHEDEEPAESFASLERINDGKLTMRSQLSSSTSEDISEGKSILWPEHFIYGNDYYRSHVLNRARATIERSNLLKRRSMMLISLSQELCQSATKGCERLKQQTDRLANLRKAQGIKHRWSSKQQ